MGHIIGIDLGTTYSCVCVIQNGDPVVIPNAEGSRTTPSVVSWKDGTRLVGTVAKRGAVTNPENTVYAVKRLMGAPFESETTQHHTKLVPYRVVQALNGDAWVHANGKDFSPPEISAMILEQMRSIAEDYLGEPVSEAVVTVPAYFDDAQRQATKAAGKIAGLDVKRIINEPTAAALAYALTNDEGQRIAVYDLGGGTFDVSILQIAQGVYAVKSTAGDTHLGGEDIDNTLVQHLVDKFKEDNGVDLSADRGALLRVKEQAQKAKHELSSSLETDINIPFIAANDSGPLHLEVKLKRSDLEILVSEIIERTLEPCQQALNDAKMTIADIDTVLLVGGQTRMPLVQKKVAEFFGKEAHRGVNPDEVVAMGAAIQGAALSGEIDDVLLLDVTPLSLGVETGGGVFFPLIQRNTTIPCRESEIFTTSVDNQPFVPIHVLQGERRMAEDNKSLAKFELEPIPPAPRGVPEIEVAFEIDVDGIVSVAAKDLGTGKEKNVRVVASGGLKEDDIDRLVAEAEQFRSSDEKRKELAELRNTAQSLLYTTERALTECAELVDPSILAEVQLDADELKGVLDAGDVIAIREGLSKLELSAYKIAESMYGSTE